MTNSVTAPSHQSLLELNLKTQKPGEKGKEGMEWVA